MVARDDDEARELERPLAFRASLGLNARRMRPSESRELEPALAPTVRLALELPEDRAVDPRLVTSALRRACELAGAPGPEHVGPGALAGGGGHAPGLPLAAAGRRLAAAP